MKKKNQKLEFLSIIF